MKKITKCLLSLCLLAASSAAFSYAVYNHLPRQVIFLDKQGFRGMDVEIPSDGKAACNPKSPGCYGEMWFVVKSFYDPRLCAWKGKLKKNEKGHYFVIEPTHGEADEVCKITHYRS